MIASNQEPWSGYWRQIGYGWLFDETLQRNMPAIRCLYTPTLSSYETPWVPTYKMLQAARVQDVEPVWEEDEEENDEPAAKRQRLY